VSDSSEFDVFVAPDVLVVVERRRLVSSAQQFGIDWDGPQTTALHQAIFEQLPEPIHTASLQDDVASAVAALSVRERAGLAVSLLRTRGVPSWCVWCVLFAALGVVWWWHR
jgi:hypothetical protein